MTTPEHTLVGVHAAIALNLSRRFGWTVIVLAGVASNLPGLDGLPMLIDMSRFESLHRVWGHNLTFIVVSSIIAGWTQFRFRWIERLGVRTQKYLPPDVVLPEETHRVPLTVLVLVCVFVQIIHLPCDMVVSGGRGISDWPVRPFWPFLDASYVFPLIPWGDIGPTIILMVGTIVLAVRRQNIALTSAATLVVLCAYLVLRGWADGA